MVALRIAETTAWYEALPAPVVRLGEPPPEPVSESELSWIWAGQRYPAGALGLVDGRALRVLNPGRRGGGAGPDFLDAVLEIDGAPVRGDVELHVRSSWFRAHGHATDPAYDRVALHVVFRADEGAFTRLSNGAEAPVAAFAPWFDSRRDELQRWLGAEPLWREPCREAVARLGEEVVHSRLREAGMRRFETKVAAMRALAEQHGEAEAVWRSLFDVMGVGGDREGFRRLAAAFPERFARTLLLEVEDDGVTVLTRALLHAAGLTPAVEPGEGPLRLRPPLVASGRPANRPERRLAGIAALYGRGGSDFPDFVRTTVAGAETAKDLVADWQVSARGIALIGGDRARELVLNVALPFAVQERGLEPRVSSLLDGLAAAPSYGKTAFLERNLGGVAGRRLARGALAQQGLLAFLGEWCSRGGCGRCPLS